MSGRKDDSEIDKIEEVQEALRETIDKAKRLADQAERLIQQHKKKLEGET